MAESIVATNNGSIVINAITNYLGAGALGRANTLTADADISLTPPPSRSPIQPSWPARAATGSWFSMPPAN